jgi:hypothetical protein
MDLKKAGNEEWPFLKFWKDVIFIQTAEWRKILITWNDKMKFYKNTFHELK